MATLVARISDVVLRIATEFRSVRTALDGKAAKSFAAAADIFAGTDTAKILVAQALVNAQKFVALVDATSVAPNLNTGINFKWTRTAASTLAAMTGLKEGWCGTICLDGPGALTLDSSYDTLGQTLSFSTATGTFDYLDYQVVNAAGGVKSVQVRLRKAA